MVKCQSLVLCLTEYSIPLEAFLYRHVLEIA